MVVCEMGIAKSMYFCKTFPLCLFLVDVKQRIQRIGKIFHTKPHILESLYAILNILHEQQQLKYPKLFILWQKGMFSMGYVIAFF